MRKLTLNQINCNGSERHVWCSTKKEADYIIAETIVNDMLSSVPPRGFIKMWPVLKYTWLEGEDKQKLYYIECHELIFNAFEKLGINEEKMDKHMRMKSKQPFSRYVKHSPNAEQDAFMSKKQFSDIQKMMILLLKKMIRKNCYVKQ